MPRPNNSIDDYHPQNGRLLREDSSVFNVGDYLDRITTPFHHLRMADMTPLLELKSNYGISALRDVTTETGAGTVTNDGSEYAVATTTAGSDVARLRSAEYIRYVPGLAVEAGVGLRMSGTPIGSQVARWGPFSTTSGEGFYFGQDATGVFVALRKDDTETFRIYQPDWNTDTLDGSAVGKRGTVTNPSRLTLGLMDGVIYQVTYQWYGYGVIEWSVTIPDANTRPTKIVVHRAKVDGSVSVSNPNLPITVDVSNGGTTGNPLTAYVGGRQATVLGAYAPNRRLTSQYRLQVSSVGTTFVPLVSFRRKLPTFEGVSVKLGQVSLLTDAELVFRIVLNGTLTGASWGTPTDHTDSETAVQSDMAASALSGGVVINQGFASAQKAGSISNRIALPQIDFIDDQPVTLLARRTVGTNGTVDALLEIREEW